MKETGLELRQLVCAQKVTVEKSFWSISPTCPALLPFTSTAKREFPYYDSYGDVWVNP